jgi:tRNA/tmRNA/rRNA uracil-C5-methylase (TrmA/RlmC/RlmD family)
MITVLETATCKHYGICGGCTCRTAADGTQSPPPYHEQLATKEAMVRGLLSPFEVESWQPILGSPEIWNYRNKMEYAFGLRDWKVRELVLGLRQTGRFDRVVDL